MFVGIVNFFCYVIPYGRARSLAQSIFQSFLSAYLGPSVLFCRGVVIVSGTDFQSIHPLLCPMAVA